MTTIISSLKVKNYAEFKKSFITHEQERISSGIKVIGVYKSTEDENQVTIISEATNDKVAQDFLTNPNSAAAMKMFGIITYPDSK